MNRTKIEERSGKTIQHTLRKHWGSLKQIQGRLLQFFISVFRNARVVSSSTTTLYRTWVFSETSRDLFRRLVLRQKQGSNCLVFSIGVLSFKRATTVPNKLIDSQRYKRHRRKNTDRIPFTRTFHRYNHAIRPFSSKTLNYFKTIQRLALSSCNL